MKKRRGRPSLPKSEKRFVYPLRISRNELGQFEAAASKEALRTPAWMRKTLTSESARVLGALAIK
jgi:Glu-tRNA(Gln) amidotransferase subunit E-like FAD-binding protein